MKPEWSKVAYRIVEGLGVKPGELVKILCLIDRLDVLQEILLAIELAGATPLPEITPPKYLRQLLLNADPGHLSNWDHYRKNWLEQVDRLLVLQGEYLNFNHLPIENLNNWQQATLRLTTLQEDRRLPSLLVAIPTRTRAKQSNLTLASLDTLLLPALCVSPKELQEEITRVLKVVNNSSTVIIYSKDRAYQLQLKLDDRPWLSDDGYMQQEDQDQGAIVSNLPAGAIYTPALETETKGTIWLPTAGSARDAVFHFEKGRIIKIEAAHGADELNAFLDNHSGEPRRVSHIGIGLNPYLRQFVEWTLVDEHIHGNLILALGENRYMGGRNQSSLNIDFIIPGATLQIDNRVIVEAGKVII